MHRLSVIMPVYNTAPYLERSLQSILDQEIDNLQVILVDDSSTDGSSHLCDRLASKHDEVMAIHLPRNCGPAIARNVGLDLADGNYCTFMDSDDLLPMKAYLPMLEFAENEQLDIVRSDMGYFAREDDVKCVTNVGMQRVVRDKSKIDRYALAFFSNPPGELHIPFDMGGSACTSLYRRTLFERGGIRFPNIPHMICEDLVFNYYCFRRANSVGFLPHVCYHYRSNPHSRSLSPQRDKIERAMYTAEFIERMIQTDGYNAIDCQYAYGFAIDIIRAFIKNFMYSSIPMPELKEWFDSQHDYMILDRAWNHYPWRDLPVKHRIGFEAFYKKKFWVLWTLVAGQEYVRSVIKH